MKAGFYLGNHTYEVKEIKDRKPVDHEVKIEVAWCGLCGTDIHKEKMERVLSYRQLF